MRTEQYRQLTELHLLHRIWKSELELALQEITFWEELLGTLGEGLDPAITNANDWKTEISQLHHFRRLTTGLLAEIQAINSEVATGVQTGHVLDIETRLDHQYLRKEIDSFHADFRTFKARIRQHLIAQPTF
ncbi:hypothetical protein [Spirosoma utsteinense]|uniref:Uncharacterized protein n=1 Tax=Spirosoma utsteinense TaxID=2585773 RepID=A0ABR6WB66_9BACT|nr:hypothetical protein [Spirosoma utsteinense]MBC3787601.1 hypothetical protein [Spirosoma utsteinense]MBC3793197.1 hypothetical protein [Spirosoma utsteinense]